MIICFNYLYKSTFELVFFIEIRIVITFTLQRSLGGCVSHDKSDALGIFDFFFQTLHFFCLKYEKSINSWRGDGFMQNVMFYF